MPRSLQQCFHLEGNFFPKGNLGNWKAIKKEMKNLKEIGRKFDDEVRNLKEM